MPALPGQASVVAGGWKCLFCEWIWSVVMLKGDDARCLRRRFFKRLAKVVVAAVALEAAGCAGDAGGARCPGVAARPRAVPSPRRMGARRPAWEGCAGPAEGRGRGCSHPCRPHQVLLIHRLSCTSQTSFNVACLSLFELLFGIKQNNQRFVMFPALNRITKLEEQLKYLWLAQFCVQCAGVNAKRCCGRRWSCFRFIRAVWRAEPGPPPVSAGLPERAGASGPDPAAFALAKRPLNSGV